MAYILTKQHEKAAKSGQNRHYPQAGSLGVVGSIPTSSTLLKALETTKFKKFQSF
jgi:hypothetical protein